jgi:c-di-GMP-binding flagellar brake protein YcgR
MDALGSMVSIIPLDERFAQDRFAYGLKFTDVLGRDWNEIIQWILTKQRKEIRKHKENF